MKQEKINEQTGEKVILNFNLNLIESRCTSDWSAYTHTSISHVWRLFEEQKKGAVKELTQKNINFPCNLF